MRAKYSDQYILVDGLKSPSKIVQTAVEYGYKKAVSIYEFIALYKYVSPTMLVDFGGSKEKVVAAVEGLCARFKKTPEELKKELYIAAYFMFCAPAPVWSAI